MDSITLPGRPVEILLVDDSPDDALLTKKALEQEPNAHTLHVVSSGDEALDYLCRRGNHANAVRPDIILLDLNMPRKSGHEVLSEIKADPCLMTIPVIIVTTSDSEQDIHKSYRLHANSFVTKPMALDSFYRAIRSILNFWVMTAKLPPNKIYEHADTCSCNRRQRR